ncbi:hypothetical protein EVAR_31946_1 [Eumeta japonica]|uniref:Uncharacterized protein n=1 Tax=Eumeta variegata TaxID=151549 RepID=A0A4C1WR95_EUMVA|nr:hypothetical protein EVAR_31946_1 [Eumeta japonica]
MKSVVVVLQGEGQTSIRVIRKQATIAAHGHSHLQKSRAHKGVAPLLDSNRISDTGVMEGGRCWKGYWSDKWGVVA